MKLIRNILFLMLLLLGYKGAAQHQALYHYGLEQGLPDLRVYDAVQDGEGYIWLATASGACRLDAFQTDVFTVRHGLAHNQLRKIHVDRKNDLWLLSLAAISRYQKPDFEVLDTIPFLGPDRILSIAEDQYGGIWMTTARTLHHFHDSTLSQQTLLGELGFESGATLVGTDAAGMLWLADNQEALRFDAALANQTRYSLSDASNQEQVVYALDRLGNLWSASTQGVSKLEQGKGQRMLIPAGEIPGWQEATCLFVDRRQDVWLGGEKGGLYWYHLEDGQYQLMSRFLEGINCRDIFQDREQNYWISTEGEGVYQLSEGTARVILQNRLRFQGLQTLMNQRSDRLIGMEQDQKGHFWLAWEAGQLLRMESLQGVPVQSQSYDLSRIFGPRFQIRQILTLQEGDLLVASDQGLALGNEQGFQKIKGLEKPFSISQVASGDIFIGTETPLVWRLNWQDLQKRLQSPAPLPFSMEQEFWALQTREVIQDQQGDFWLAWLGGLYHIDSAKERVDYKTVDPVFRAGISDIEIGPDGSRWFATQGSGLAVLRDDFSGPLFINRETGLKNQVVNQILVQEHDSSLWVATAQGLGHIKLGAWPEKPLEIRWFDRKDGLKSNQVLDLLPFGDYLLVLTSGGLTVLETGDYQEPNLPPTVFLTGLKVGDQAYDYSQSHTLPSDSNSITVNFSALGFRHPGDMRFQYLLEGGDDQWQETPKTELRFSSLSPGNYSLYIMAVDRDRQFSEVPARLDFVIRPPFYQSLWFLLLVGFLILALSVFVYRYLSHKRRKEWLEQKVNEKTIALQNKISELGIANEDLRQFAYVASHDLKTPLRTIVNYLQLLDRRYKGQLDEQADEFIDFAVNSSKQLYQMINDLLIYSELGQEDAQTEYFELGEVLEKVKVNLGDYLKEKNAVLSSCPLPKIMGSRAEWEILLRNLIENGVKFNQSPRPEVRITCKDVPGFWILSVQDNGIGIPQDYQQKIFQLFQRLHTIEFPGNGLGLAMSKRIVEMRGGNIWLESEPGKGTQVFFSIPK